jgi:hypothetical protein
MARALANGPTSSASTPSLLRVRQVLLVPTPNNGTPLAGPDHLGSFVDALTNLADLVPDKPASPARDCPILCLTGRDGHGQLAAWMRSL